MSPVELAEACIARVETLDHAVNALIARDFDRMMNSARDAETAVMAGDAPGPLHGLPFAVKDMIDVAGLPTTFGSQAFAGNIATGDDAIVAAMRAAGGLAMGKTNTPEERAGSNTRNRANGVSANPYDLTRSCAGPSDGSAVAQALFAQGRYHRDWQAFFEIHDFITSPAVTISPRPWREIYPTEIDGTPTKSYYHWLAMAYASTIPGHPSITIPCGKGGNGMPFALQIVGRRHDDLGVLAVAAELEAIIAGTDLAVPAPDLSALRAAPPLSQADEFLTFN